MTPTTPRRRILMYLVSKTRDLPMLARLAVRLERLGHEVHIVPPFDLWTLHRVRPHAIIVHTTEDPTLRQACMAARRRGAHVINLLGEGAVSTYTEASWAGTQNPEKVDQLCIAWGPGAKELLVKYGRDPDRVVVCGNPSFDKYRGPLMEREAFCRQYGLDPARPIMLYATSLVPREGLDPEDFKHLEGFKDRIFPLYNNLRRTLTDLFFDLAEARPEVQFVVKLHPADNPGIFEETQTARGTSNVLILRHSDIDIADALNVCDLMMHWNSTSSTEGWLLGKPTLFVHLEPQLDFWLSRFRDGSDLVRTREELFERVDHYLDGGKIPPDILAAREAYIREWYYEVDGKSIDRVTKTVHDHLVRNDVRPTRAFRPIEAFYHAQVWYRRLARKSPPDRILPWKPYAQIYATEDEVEAALEAAREELDTGRPAATWQAIRA